MKTLLSINNYHYYRGGAETVFLEQNRLFEELGWQVVPFAMHHPKNLSTPWSPYFVDEIEFGSEYSAMEKLVRLPKVIYSLEAKRKLRKLIELVKPDICHAHNIYHHISPSILGTLRQRGIPTVITLHDLKIACPAYNMLAPDGICERCRNGRLYNVVLNRCIKGSALMSTMVMAEALLHRMIGSYRNNVDRFIVPSRFYIKKFCEWGMDESLFRHVPNFVDVQRFTPQYEPGDSFIYFGRLSREKGLETLIRACAQARCRLNIVGTGPDLEQLQALSSRLGAEVAFMGYLTGEPLRDAVRQSRAVVLPSEWYENAPMSVLEAYALGKPIIGARIGGIPELVRENQTGIGFESANVESLAAALLDFNSRSSSEVQAMGRSARSWVEQEFTVEVYRDRILKVYRELGIDSRAAGPSSSHLTA